MKHVIQNPRNIGGFGLSGCLWVVLLSFIAAGTLLVSSFRSVWYGYVLGAIVGLLAFCLTLKLLNLLMIAIDGDGKPPCRRCGAKGLIVTEMTNGKASCKVDGAWTMVCRQCGERYLQKERRCFVLDEQNRKTSWVRWKPFRGWRMDELPIPQTKVYRGISVVNTAETVGLDESKTDQAPNPILCLQSGSDDDTHRKDSDIAQDFSVGSCRLSGEADKSEKND